MITPLLSRIVIDPAVAETAMAAAVRRNATGVEVIEGSTSSYAGGIRHLAPAAGKRLLLVERFKGRALKTCQGGRPGYACCSLHTLADANNCAMECTYCILQYYMTSPHLSAFANLEELLAEVRNHTSACPERVFRISTGELSDSLLLDPLTESTRVLVPFFRDRPNTILELKTKTDNIENLLGLDPGERTVISWSLNPDEVIAGEELKTASLSARLAAARAAAQHGYPVGFHFDPIVHDRGWKESYASLVDLLFDAVPPDRIAWISLGCLRFRPEMKGTLQRRFPRSRLRYGELIRAQDGKLRYPKPLRVEMYRSVVGRLRDRIPEPPAGPVVYLCMEAPDVWKRVLQASPTAGELDCLFAASFGRRFPDASLPPPKLEHYRTSWVKS